MTILNCWRIGIMNEMAYLLYEADAWLSYDSMVLMGVFTSETAFHEAVAQLVRSRLEIDGMNAYNSYDEESLEEVETLTGEEREKEIDGIVEKVAEEFFGNDLQTQSYDTNLYAAYVTLNELNEDGIR